MLASGGDAVRLYDTEEYHLHQKYKPMTYPRKRIAQDIGWSNDGRFFGIVVSGDPILEITEVGETMKNYAIFEVSEASALAFPKHSTGVFAVGTNTGVVKTVNYLKKKELISFPSCDAKITTMDYSFSDKSIAAGTVDGRVIILGINRRSIATEYHLPTPQIISSVKFNNNRRGILAVGSHDGNVTVYNTNFNSVECKFSDHTALCTGVCFSPLNKQFLCTIGYDYHVFCYDMRNRRQVLKVSIPAAGSSLDVHKNGNTLAVATVCGSVCIYDLRNTRAPMKQIITKGCTIKVMYQLELEESKQSCTGKASSLERLVHRRNSNEVTPAFDTHVSITEESQSSDDSNGIDSIFSPIGSNSPGKLSKDISLLSISSASKIHDVKILSFSSKRGSPCSSISCNNSEEFATGLLKMQHKRSDLPFLHLSSITEKAGDEVKLLKSTEEFSVPKALYPVVQNGHANLEESEVPKSPREVRQNSPEGSVNCEVYETPKKAGQSRHSVCNNSLSSSVEKCRDELSEVNISDLLNKYSITKGLGKECDVSNSLNSSDEFNEMEKDEVAILPAVVLPTSAQKEETEKVEPLSQQLADVKDEACAVPQVPSELMSSLKEHIDAKLFEHSDTVYANLMKMHLFNIISHSKQEVMLKKILKCLGEQPVIEKEDKCVGTR